MKTRATIFIAALLLAFHARADLTASLSASVQNAGAGQIVVFQGTLTNTGTCPLFLNNIAFALSGSSGAELISGSNAFYANVPGILDAGASYTGPVFSVTVAGAAPPADYTGSVTVQGGTNIFAANDLAGTPFTALSPAVSVAANAPIASESGPIEGVLSVTRTGGTTTSLPVSFSIGGTAVNGTDYQTISSPATIAAGSSTAYVIIVPILRQTVLGNRTVTLTLQSSPLYTLGATTTGTVTIQDTPYNDWRAQYFGASENAPQTFPTADWSGGGIDNVIAYALGMNPTHPDQRLLPTVAINSNYVTLSYVPSPNATDVTYNVEASTDLVNWSATNVQEISDPNPNGSEFQYIYPIGPGNPQVFLRLRVNQLDW